MVWRSSTELLSSTGANANLSQAGNGPVRMGQLFVCSCGRSGLTSARDRCFRRQKRRLKAVSNSKATSTAALHRQQRAVTIQTKPPMNTHVLALADGGRQCTTRVQDGAPFPLPQRAQGRGSSRRTPHLSVRTYVIYGCCRHAESRNSRATLPGPGTCSLSCKRRSDRIGPGPALRCTRVSGEWRGGFELRQARCCSSRRAGTTDGSCPN
jgi:hypothetical protein